MARQDSQDLITLAVRSIVLACAVGGMAALAPSYAAPLTPRLDSLPRLMLWAWERPEDLRGLDPRIGVAFLAQAIHISVPDVRIEPRRQPLRVSPGTALVAVTRIEVGPATQMLDTIDLDGLASAIVRTASLPRVAGIQVDFDAVESERDMYATLLRRVRRTLDPAMPLSMTALASWCAGDRWLSGLPVDEAVPMLFRMGPANEAFRDMARSSRTASSECRTAIGTSLDEPLDLTRDHRRVYAFSPRPWTLATVREAQARFRR